MHEPPRAAIFLGVDISIFPADCVRLSVPCAGGIPLSDTVGGNIRFGLEGKWNAGPRRSDPAGRGLAAWGPTSLASNLGWTMVGERGIIVRWTKRRAAIARVAIDPQFCCSTRSRPWIPRPKKRSAGAEECAPVPDLPDVLPPRVDGQRRGPDSGDEPR